MKSRPSYLYFLRPVGMVGPIKIGVSQRPKERRHQCTAVSPFPLELVTQVEIDRSVEGRVHTLLCEHHSHAEWFHAHPEVLALMQTVIDGAFDPSGLPEDLGPVRHLRKKLRVFDTLDWEYTKLRDDFFRAQRKIIEARGFRDGEPYPLAPSAFHVMSVNWKQNFLAVAKQQIAEAETIEIAA